MSLPQNKKIVLFDGVCNLCNSAVLTIVKYDQKNEFVFTALSSNTGQEILNTIQVDTSKIDSIILYNPDTTYFIKSSAALKIMNAFGGIWKLSTVFWIIPSPLRNLVYDFIAKNRYKWFGKKDQCMIPSTELKSKFLS